MNNNTLQKLLQRVLYSSNRCSKIKNQLLHQRHKTLDRVPNTLLEKLEGGEGLFEIRIKAGNNIFRIFCCFDEGSLVILLNGFIKKTQKTPKQQIERAKRIMKGYFNDKRNGKDKERQDYGSADI